MALTVDLKQIEMQSACIQSRIELHISCNQYSFELISRLEQVERLKPSQRLGLLS